jgi:Flp pilus assembly pilin Flp
MTLTHFISEFYREESGQDLLEYALVLAAVLTAVVTGSNSIANVITNALNTLTTRIQAIVT